MREGGENSCFHSTFFAEHPFSSLSLNTFMFASNNNSNNNDNNYAVSKSLQNNEAVCLLDFFLISIFFSVLHACIYFLRLSFPVIMLVVAWRCPFKFWLVGEQDHRRYTKKRTLIHKFHFKEKGKNIIITIYLLFSYVKSTLLLFLLDGDLYYFLNTYFFAGF